MKRLEAPYTIEFMMRQLPRSQEFAPTWTFDPAFKGGRPPEGSKPSTSLQVE